ncbi:hypothetical protein EV426DRAFT_360464 [Tirmania nivea]|nr:hypothetical protein EV426DRAFT_360464 [Tirmania nivea]
MKRIQRKLSLIENPNLPISHLIECLLLIARYSANFLILAGCSLSHKLVFAGVFLFYNAFVTLRRHSDFPNNAAGIITNNARAPVLEYSSTPPPERAQPPIQNPNSRHPSLYTWTVSSGCEGIPFQTAPLHSLPPRSQLPCSGDNCKIEILDQCRLQLHAML